MLELSGQKRWGGLADLCAGAPYAAFPQEHRGSHGRFSFHMVMVDRMDRDLNDSCIPETLLALPVYAESENTWAWRDHGGGWRQETAVPEHPMLVPQNSSSKWQVRGAPTLLLLAIPTSTVRRVLGTPASAHFNDDLFTSSIQILDDDLIGPLMRRLWQSASGEHPKDRLLTDCALATLVTHLKQRFTSEDDDAKSAALLSWRMKRVVEFVDAHLHTQIGIADLSKIAGLSVRHFARAFKERTGETPHRWLMQRRVQRAIELLRDGSEPLAQVAYECGFSSQSHFTKVFRQISGITPKRWMSQNVE